MFKTLGIDCSTSYGVTKSWNKSPCQVQRVYDHSPIRSGCENPFFGVTKYCSLKGNENRLVRASVAADYSDSLPDSSNCTSHTSYHPLEEVREHKGVHDTKLTGAETARTTVEVNNTALLLFPGNVHREPHEQVSWAEFQYVIDGFGDIYFKIRDEENILQDREASNPVNILFGMDISEYESRSLDASDYSGLEFDFLEDITLQSDYSESEESEMLGMQDSSEILESFSYVHPIYFAKCLTKAVNAEFCKMMDNPSNGVSIWGHLKPASVDDEAYLQRLFNDEYIDGYISDLTDGELLNYSASGEGSCKRSTIYILEIITIHLYSVYGVQLGIDVDDFLEAEPDALIDSVPSVLDKFREQGMTSKLGLRALCKKKGLNAEGASLVGIDSLGLDVRVFSGTEVQTLRFPFKAKALSEGAALKQIQYLLFPKSHRKKLRTREKPDNDELF